MLAKSLLCPRSRTPFCRQKSRKRPMLVETLEARNRRSAAALSAAVLTDKPDYAPGETAHIRATGFQLGETVQLRVVHIDGRPNDAADHAPWQVTDGGAG